MSSLIWFRMICLKNGINVSESQLSLLDRFVSLLLQKNRNINLISRKDESNIWEVHILHSISPIFYFSFAKLRYVMDLGTGGGLPGIPLKILLSFLNITLIDSTKKKINAVEQIVRDLGLTGVDVMCARAEDMAKDASFKNKFDAIICRAVGSLKNLVRWSAPLLNSDSKPPSSDTGERKMKILPGTLIAFKGGDLTSEINDARRIAKNISIQEIPLVFHGSETLSLMDKKILLVRSQT